MSPFVRLALDLIEAPNTASGLRQAAVAAALTAFDQEVELPAGAHMTLWRWLLRSGAGSHVLHSHEIAHPDVAADAVRILTTDDDAGEDARDLAMAALRGENLATVTDSDLVLMAERVIDEGRTRRFTYLVESVHELNGLTPDFLKVLRDRLALSSVPSVRAAGIEVGALLPRLDDYFTEWMLGDASPIVRRTVLELLEGVELLDRGRAAAIVRRHLASAERHRTVIAAGLSTLGALVKREPETSSGNR